MKETGKPSFRRRRYIIDRSYQSKFISVVLLSIFVIFLLCTILIMYVLSTVMDQFFDIPGAAARYPQMLKTILLGIWPWLVVILVVGFVLSVLISHQIAGPIYRLKTVSREIAAGNYRARVKFRKNDQLHDVADAVNKITRKLGGVIEDDKKLLGQVNKLLLQIDEMAEAGSLNQKVYKKIKDALRGLLRKIEGQLVE